MPEEKIRVYDEENILDTKNVESFKNFLRYEYKHETSKLGAQGMNNLNLVKILSDKKLSNIYLSNLEKGLFNPNFSKETINQLYNDVNEGYGIHVLVNGLPRGKELFETTFKSIGIPKVEFVDKTQYATVEAYLNK